MTLKFTANDTTKQFALSELNLTINASDVFADAKGKLFVDERTTKFGIFLIFPFFLT